MTTINAPQFAEMTKEQIIALCQQQAAALLAASQQPARKITYKVGEKGGISIYGLGRFPVTAYASQWERIIGDIENLKAFMRANEKLLTRKPM